MIREIIAKWEKNKQALENWFKTKHPKDYAEIVKQIVLLVINSPDNEGYENYNSEKITMVDDGDYQGTQLFIFPKDTYQPGPGDYIITHTYYGSCSGCDTLEGIREYSDEPPNGEQVKDYMGLALNLIQKMKQLKDIDE